MDLVPGWPRASVNLALAANATRSGVVSLGDVWSVADHLGQDASHDPASWVGAWSQIADEWLDRARLAAADGGRAQLHAGYARLLADRLMADGEEREANYLASLGLIAGALDSFGEPCRRVEIPFMGTALPGLWMSGRSTATVVFFPGLDTTKEVWLALAGPDLARVGLNVLFLDGPGQGESLRVGALTLRHDTEVVFEAALQWLAGEHQIAASDTVVIGASFGGYLAARAAARTNGLAGSVIWGAVWDYHEVWNERLKGSAGSPVDFSHICRMTGAEDAASAVGRLRPFTMSGLAQDIVDPILVLHGALDAQVPLAQAHRLIESVSAHDKTLIVFEGEGKGASHVQVDNLAIGSNRINAWIRERLVFDQPGSDFGGTGDRRTGESSGQ